jgi:hypothetical protein
VSHQQAPILVPRSEVPQVAIDKKARWLANMFYTNPPNIPADLFATEVGVAICARSAHRSPTFDTDHGQAMSG